MPSSDETGNSLMVVLSQDDLVGATVETLKDINLQERQYLLKSDKVKAATKIYEIQTTNASDKYSSFFVDANVVSNGTINVCTEVDPLFFVLPIIKEAASRWVPLDQICAALPFEFNQVSDSKQLGHVCVETDELGDMMLYKYSEERALSWLIKKHRRTCQVIMDMMLEQKEARAIEQNKNPKALILEVDDDYKHMSTNTDKAQKCVLKETELKQAKVDAYYCICEYIDSEWQKRLGSALNILLSEENNSTEKKGTKRGANVNSTSYESEADKMQLYTMGAVAVSPEAEEKEMKKKLNASQSHGLKKLKKVKTKGMKSMASFFTAMKK